MKNRIRLFGAFLGLVFGLCMLCIVLKDVPFPLPIKFAILAMCALVGAMLPREELNDITSEEAGNNQHGSSRWATSEEEQKQFDFIMDKNATEPGIVIGRKGKQYEVDTSDQNASLIAPPGSGKTKQLIIPTINYNALVNKNTKGKGASMVLTDNKGELYTTTAKRLQNCGYKTPALDFSNPLLSPKFNLLHNVNKHMDRYLNANTEKEKILGYANAEKYAKILGESLVGSMDVSQQAEASAFFNETSKGLLTGIILLVSEYGYENQRHIISVFKLIIELNGLAEGSTQEQQTSRLDHLLEHISNKRIKNYTGSATSSDVRTSMNVFSSALSKLVKFIDAELEQMVCGHDNSLNDVDFIENPTAIFIICPDENPTRHFFASLYIRYLMNDLIEQSRKTDGTLPRKVICLWDEFGQMPAINNIDVLFSAARSRGIRFLIALQSYAQLEKNYSQKMAQIVLDSTQITIFTYVSPNARNTAEMFSKMLGSKTIKTGSVSYSKNSSVSYQLMQRPLMYPDEIMKIPQGNWIVVKAGKYPVKTKLPFWWNYINKDDMPKYKPEFKSNIIEISYVSASQLMKASKQTIKLYRGMFD